jgi:MFS family permease
MNITAAMPAFLIKFGGCKRATFLLSCLYGYSERRLLKHDYVPATSAVDPVTKRLSIASTWISLWTAMFSLGLFIGTISCTWTLDRFGPRKVTMAATVFLMAGVAVQVASETKETLLAGKVDCRACQQGSSP